MKRSDFKYFFQTNFLDDDLHKLILDPLNHCSKVGYTINEDGSKTLAEEGDFTIRNKCKDDEFLISGLPDPLKRFISLVKQEIIKQGVISPTIINLSALINPDPDIKTTAGQWHKDFNVMPEITDPNKLWFTMYTITDKQEVNSEFMISPSKTWPDIWNIGARDTVESNKLFGHNMTLGHQYFKKDKNDLTLLYIRWYDRG